MAEGESEYDRGSVLEVEQVNSMEHEGRSPTDQRPTRRRIWRPVLVLLVAVAAVAIPVLARMWKAAGDRGGLQPVEPFRIAGNFYYVGANASSVFLAFLVESARGRTADACQEDLGLAKQPLKQVVPQRAAAVGNLGVRAGRSHQTP
jgi:hypothetical protein